MQTYSVEPGWNVLLNDIGVEAAAALKLAGLPADLFVRREARISAEQFYAFWCALEQLYHGADVALALASAVTAEAFAPPIFAGLCSPCLSSAADRIAAYKRLIYPVTLDIEHRLGLRIRVQSRIPFGPPHVLVRFELLFWVSLARLGTREEVRPTQLILSEVPPSPEELAAFVGVDRVTFGPRPEVGFSELDARRPFVTVNDAMWNVFEPELRRRLAALSAEASWEDRVHAALLTALPAGRGSLSDIVGDLNVSARSLQRWLAAEDSSFTAVLDRTRAQLALHYLTTTALSDSEIGFLIGYEELTSFHRAFRSWTGNTPGAVRSGHATARNRHAGELRRAQ